MKFPVDVVCRGLLCIVLGTSGCAMLFTKGVLAHSTHVRGAGTYDPATGIETNRITVTLATGIPREVCEQVNLGYLDPASIDIEAWKADPEITVVENAGEVLHRLR